VVRMHGLAFAVALLPLATGAERHHTCVRAENFGNAQYTVPLHIGSPWQTLHVVPDTGSFEVVLASAECKGCGHHIRYARGNSSTFRSRSPRKDVYIKYGQGEVRAELAYDRTQFGSLVAEQQSLLLMQDNQLKDYGDAAYDGVMGLGVPSRPRPDDSDAAISASLGASTIGICFGQQDGEPGRVDLGMLPEGERPDFVQLPLRGTSHWAVKLDSMSVAGGDAPLSGCEHGCTAIVDSGTSLLAVPSAMLEQILTQIGDVQPDCSNIDALPNITITLAGHAFTMPPQTYVAKMEVVADGKTSLAVAARAQSFLGTLGGQAKAADPFSSFRQRVSSTIAHAIMLGDTATASSNEFACVPLFMEMDMSLSELPGTPIILGVPFLRAHVASFNRDERTIGLAAVPVGSTYCSSCEATSLASGVAAASTRNAEAVDTAIASSRSSERHGASLLAWPRLGRKPAGQGRVRESKVREPAAMQPPQLDSPLHTGTAHAAATPRQRPHRTPKLRVLGLRLPSWLTSAHLS